MKHPEHALDFFVHTPYNVYSLKEIPPTISIVQLKAIIELRAGIPVEHQLLNLSGTCLDDDTLVSETELKRGCVVRLLFASKVAEKLFDLTNIGDIVGLLNAGVQVIDVADAAAFGDRSRLASWNKTAMQRAFLAVCVACFNGNLDLLDSLLKYCALDLNQVTAWGRSALHFAAARGSIGCVCLLLDRGIDACLLDMDEKTAQDIASELGHVHCKRRIWLYRWNIKPTLRRDKKRRHDQDENVRFPTLGEKPPLTPNGFSHTDESHPHEDKRGLPKVHSKHSVNTFARADCTVLEAIPQFTRPAPHFAGTPTEPAPQLELRRMESSNSIDSVTNDEGNSMKQADWENQDEVQLLVRLAEKYGYTVVDNRDGSRLGQRDTPRRVDSPKGAQNSAETNERMEEMDQQETNGTRKEGESNRRSRHDGIIKKISLLEKRKEAKGSSPVESFDRTEIDTKVYESQKSRVSRQQDGDDAAEGLNKETVLLVSSRTNIKSQEINQAETNQLISDIDPEDSETASEAKKILLEMKETNIGPKSENDETKIGHVELSTDNDVSSRGSRSTFEQWLERKSKQKRDSASKETYQASEGEKRRDMCEQAFKKWLQLKKVRYRSASVSPRPSFQDHTRETARPKSGLSFDTWMKRKSKVQPRSYSVVETKTHLPVKRAYSSGVTYAEWIDSKRDQLKQKAGDEDSNGVTQGRTRLNGITFESWVKEKTKQFQIERVEKDTEKMRLEYEKEMEYERKIKSGSVKTFENWVFEKNLEDRARKAKEKKAIRTSRKNKTKYEEDSNLVYNMWLMNKHLSEMEKEEQHLIALREEWERKRKMQLNSKTNNGEAEL